MPPTITATHVASSGTTAQPNDTIILVLGQVGAGKSSFINSAIGRDVASVNGGYIEGSHTKAITSFVIDGDVNSSSSGRIVLVDTPGFNDAPSGDIENIQRISRFLASRPRSALAGILYIYEITQDRIPSDDGFMSPSKFARLPASRNVLLTTVKWSELRSHSHGEERQERIRAQWAHIYDDGARIVTFNDSRDSAREIVDRLCLYTTSVETLQHDLVKIFNGGDGSRSSSRTGSRPGSIHSKDPGCFGSLFRNRNAH
ncbi:hypothetical protein C0991_008263 [Blastosporella zonata]|nr:hypothetical protein C0991_008263 [Blastosporella zonata]